MEWLHAASEFFKDMPGYLTQWTAALGGWSYALLFLVVFCETGLVFTPFLPGDSLLFALGALCAAEGAYLDPFVLGPLLWAAALSGDAVNYSVGRAIGARLAARLSKGRSVVNSDHLARTQAFFSRHGGKTIVLARFAPIVRTYAPFVAGMGQMALPRFAAFSATGAALWIGAFLFAGYKFGNRPEVKSNFHYAIVAIVAVSLAPAAFELGRARWAGPKPERSGEGAS